jgi:hypothetical protein
MGDTYTQLYIQLVFAVKGRNSFIQYTWEEELYKYITAVVQNDKHKLLAINGMPIIYTFYRLASGNCNFRFSERHKKSKQ